MQAFLSTADDAQLIANGYEPIACAGKAPVSEGWQGLPITVERIAAMRANNPGARNTGLRTGRLFVLDIDIRDPVHAADIRDLVFQYFGPTPLVRVGAKGFALCYRVEEPLPKIAILTHNETKVELLSKGLQFVAFGIHPETGAPYEWIGKTAFDEAGTPLNCPLDTLPSVHQQQIEKFGNACVASFGRLGYNNARIQRASEARKLGKESSIREDDELNIGYARECLFSKVVNGEVATIGQLGSDTIYELACHLMDYYALSEEKTAELMLEIWYPHCIPNTLETEARLIIAHAARYIQNEPGARATPRVAEAFGAALDQLPEQPQAILAAPEGSAIPKFKGPEPADERAKRGIPEIRMLAPIWYQRGTHTIHEGAPGAHKSRILLQDAICLYNGLKVMDQTPIERCRCVYVNWDTKADELDRRVQEIASALHRDSTTDRPSTAGIDIWDMTDSDEVLMNISREHAGNPQPTAWGKYFLETIRARREHTFVVLDGVMDALIFHDNLSIDEMCVRRVLRRMEQWCSECNMSLQSILHPSRSAQREGIGGMSYANAWFGKPREYQTYRRIYNPHKPKLAGKRKITDADIPLSDLWVERRVIKGTRGSENHYVWLDYERGGMRAEQPFKPAVVELVEVEPEPQPDEIPF